MVRFRRLTWTFPSTFAPDSAPEEIRAVHSEKIAPFLRTQKRTGGQGRQLRRQWGDVGARLW